MKTKFTTLIMIAFIAVFSISCSNDDNPTPPIIPVAIDGFTWSENGTATVLTVNDPHATAQYNTIFAIRQGVTIYEINLTSLAVGTYPFDVNNSLFYNNNNNPTGNFIPTSGSVIITANANNKLSGTFTAIGTGNNVTSISGRFTNIAIQP